MSVINKQFEQGAFPRLTADGTRAANKLGAALHVIQAYAIELRCIVVKAFSVVVQLYE